MATQLTNSIRDALTDLVTETFADVLNEATSVFSNINNMNLTTLETSTVDAFEQILNSLQVLANDLLVDIQNALTQPLQDILSVGEFITFITGVYGILSLTIMPVVYTKITITLAKPLLESIVALVGSLYDLTKGVGFLVLIRHEVIFLLIFKKLELKKAKFTINRSINSLKLKTQLNYQVTTFVAGIFLIGIFFGMKLIMEFLSDIRNDVYSKVK